MPAPAHDPHVRESSPPRRALLLGLLVAPLAGCGLRPLLIGPEGEVVALEFAAITIEAPDTPLGFALREHLLEVLNVAAYDQAPRYRLTLDVERRRKALGVQLDDTVTRYDLTLGVFYRLDPIVAENTPAPVPLYRSAVRRTASFDVLREPFATLVAERDAEDRATLEAALEIRTRLALYFDERTA